MPEYLLQTSVIVLNWNGKHLLSDCLTSLECQTCRDFEIILVDNGSCDSSVEFVKKHFPEVRVISLTENRGFAGGNNVGIQHARGRYIALLNNDAKADSRWLEELTNALDSHPEIDFCASKIVFYDRHDLIDTAGDYFSIAGSAGKIGHLDDSTKPEYNRMRPVFGACAGAAIYRKAMLDEIGLFDEDFFLSFEDVDLSFRAQLHGHKCLYFPSALVYHRVHATVGINSPQYVYYGHRNSEFVYLKNMPGWLFFKYFPMHLADIFISFGFFLFKGRGLDFLKAKWDALRALPRVLRQRRQIQYERTVSAEYIESLLQKNWWRLKVERWRRLKHAKSQNKIVPI
jgi:hypothetical protein